MANVCIPRCGEYQAQSQRENLLVMNRDILGYPLPTPFSSRDWWITLICHAYICKLHYYIQIRILEYRNRKRDTMYGLFNYTVSNGIAYWWPRDRTTVVVVLKRVVSYKKYCGHTTVTKLIWIMVGSSSR